jgi:hypothetical protein
MANNGVAEEEIIIKLNHRINSFEDRSFLIRNKKTNSKEE